MTREKMGEAWAGDISGEAPICVVTLSANAGVSLEMGGRRIWVDALHTQKIPGFSTVTPELWERMREQPSFTSPDLICFTHCHGDHYSHGLTAQAKAIWPKARVILPEAGFPDQLLLTGDEMKLDLGKLSLRFIRLPHEGAEFASVPHYGLLLSWKGFHVLIPGDCQVAGPALEQAIQGRAVDLALLDFPWVTLRRGQAFVQEVLRPRHLLVYHLPFAEDEENRYRSASQRCVQRLDVPDIRLLQEPLQQEIIELQR